MRPKRAAKRRSASTLPDDAETDEENLPTSAGDDDEGSETESSDIEVEATPRPPDPRATRHSERAATQKAVDYSSKHHPQDHSLPGFQHKAKARKKLLKNARSSISTMSKPAELLEGTIDLTNDIINEDIEAEEPEEAEQSRFRKTARKMEQENQSPRKKLRVLADTRVRGKGKKANLFKATTQSISDNVNAPTSMSESADLSALTPSEAAEFRRLIQKMRNPDHSHQNAEETDEETVDSLPKFADMGPSEDHNARRDGDEDDVYISLFAGYGHSSGDNNGGPGTANDQQNGSKTNGIETRRDSHQSQDHPPPSQFDEQFAVTEIRGTSGDLLSGLEASLQCVANENCSRPSIDIYEPNSMTTNDQSSSVPEEHAEKSSNLNRTSNRTATDHYKTPDTYYGDKESTSRQHCASEHEEIPPLEQSDNHSADLAENVQELRVQRLEAYDKSLPDLDDTLLGDYQSSQRTGSGMKGTDPTAAGISDEMSDNRSGSETLQIFD